MSAAKRRPILCIDFDGVIHGYQSGWKGAHIIPDPPVPGAIPYLLTALDSFEVAIFSSRSRNLRGRWAMQRWLAKAIAHHWEGGGNEPSLTECECWGDAAGIWRKFSWPWFKPSALMTIDDRALTFNGDWTSPEYQAGAIRSFKPWNKRLPPQCFVMGVPDSDDQLMCDMCESFFKKDGFVCPQRKGFR